MSSKKDGRVSNRPVGSDTVEAVLSGSLENLPEKESSVVRIFLSSTFTDMQAERNWLMKNAFPQLRQFCQERGLDFQIADMRWGVREDATDDHRTTELCLHEIKNCQRLSRGPNFVAFLGDKYGFRPIPSEIEVLEFKMLKNTAIKLGHDISLLLHWYQCDYNREPTMYTLQPISMQYPQYFDMTPANAGARLQAQREWWGVVEKLTTLLRESAEHLYKEGKFSEEDKHKYFRSVTESEVHAGILAADDITDKVLCFERTLIDIRLRDSLAGRFTDMIEGMRDTEADELRENLRMLKIPAKMTSAGLFRYNMQWDKVGINIFRNQEHINYINQFGNDFITNIERMITTATSDKTSSGYRSPLFEEVLHHLHFCRTKCESFCGRENILEEIQKKLKVIHKVENGKVENGKDENGKDENGTEELVDNANAEDQIREQQQAVLEERKQLQASLKEMGVTFTIGDELNDLESDPNFNPRDKMTKLPEITEFSKPLIVYGKSGCGKTALSAKAAELSKTWFPESVLMVRFLGTSTMSTAIRAVLVSLCMQISEVYKVQKQTGIDIETDYQFLVQYFAALLWQIDTKDRNLVIVLDSIDQLSQTDHAHMFNWLPHKLPTGVHMILSVVSDRLDCLNNVRLLFSDPDQFVEIKELETDTAVNIINAFCKSMHRHLSKRQKNLILDCFEKNGQPLYLRLLIDMSLLWKSYTDIDETELGSTVKEAINHLFDNLEKNHGVEIVKKSIGYLCAAKEGLTEAEMEDLLSLDDEVLQDTYIYHLPPDPEVIRLPPLLWRRVEYDINEYVVERQSGSKKVVTWYHRQFSEAAAERYLKEDVKKQFHQVLAEYFQGLWSDTCKPLQLTKGKKGSYPVAMRQVPAQPIKFGPSLYNTRKLSELPYQLIHSDQLQRVLADLFSNPDWLYAKCCTMTLTSLMEDFRLAEQKCAGNIEKKREELMAVQKMGEKVDPYEVARLKIDEEVFNAIKLVTRMVLLAADNTRKDPVNLPLMLLSQLGPDYRGSVYIEKLLQRCEKWCEECSIPLLVPSRECMVRPGGNLLYTINADVGITGEERDDGYFGTYLREDTMQLYAVCQQSARPDQICIFDLHDNGSCITKDDVGFYVRSVKFVGDNRYLLLNVYTKKDAYDPESVSEDRLYESSFASLVNFDPKPNHIAVSSTAKIIACSTGNDVTLYKKDKLSKLQSFHSAKMHEHDVTALIISPDETLLVSTDTVKTPFGGEKDSTSCVYDIKSKQKVNDIDSSIDVNQWSLVTSKNLLVTRKTGYENEGTLIVYDLASGKVLQEVVINKTYKIEKLQLHSSEEFVFIYFPNTGCINGIWIKYAELVNINSGKRYGKSPEEYKVPYAGAQVFGSDCLYYAICYWSRSEVSILFAGQVNNPLEDAVFIHVLTGHNQPIREIVVPSSLDLMLTVSLDNTIKVWDLKSVLGNFHMELSRIEQQMAQNSPSFTNHVEEINTTFDLVDVVAQFKPAVTGAKLETTRLAFNRFGDTLYVGTDNGKLQLYDVDTSELKITSDLDIGPVQLMVLSKNGRYMIVGGKKKIHVEDLLSQKQLVLEARGKISCMAESNNILIAGSAGMEAKGRVWNIETGEIIKDFELLYSFYCVAINSQGTQVVSSMFDFPVIVNLADQENDPSIDPEKMDTMMSGAICCEISPNDKYVAMSSSDGAIRVVTMEGKYVFRLQQKSSAVTLAFSPDSKNVLSAGYRSIYVWSLTDGSCKCKLTRHVDFVTSIKFDTSGRFILTVSKDKQIVLWDFKRLKSIATFPANCQINSVDLSAKVGTVAYVPEGISDLSVLKPNKALRNAIAGNTAAVTLTQQVQAVALAFMTVKKGSKSQTCCVM